ncbi:MAG: hypothetical protein AAF487_09380 [Bacteroidota bacterium]
MPSCIKEDCEGFPEENLVHVPYSIDDTLVYENGLDTISFVFLESGVTDAYSINTSFPSTNTDECEYYAFFKTRKESAFAYEIEDGYHNKHRIIFSINDHLDIYEMSNTNTFSNEQELGTIVINGIEYPNAYLMEKNASTFDAQITRIVKAPSHGIVQFTDHTRGFIWNRID